MTTSDTNTEIFVNRLYRAGVVCTCLINSNKNNTVHWEFLVEDKIIEYQSCIISDEILLWFNPIYLAEEFLRNLLRSN